jgi:hypothetical protein
LLRRARFALRKGWALYLFECAGKGVLLHFRVGENLVAAEGLVCTDELHLFELGLNFLLHRYEFGFCAHQWALPGFLCEFVQANLVKPLVTLFAFPRLCQDGLAKRAKPVFLDLLTSEHIFGIHADRHALKVLQSWV